MSPRWVVLLAGVLAGHAAAEHCSEVVLLVAQGESRTALLGRMSAELSAAEYRPRLVIGGAVDDFVEPLRRGALCGVLRFPSAKELVIQVYDADGRRFLTLSLPSPNDDAVWALKAVEWVRAEPAAYVRAAPQPPVERRWSLWLGGTARWAQGFGFGGGAQGGLGVQLSGAWGVELVVLGPVWTSVQLADAAASLREVALAARLTWSPRIEDRWTFPLGVGVGGRQIHAQGLTPADRATVADALGFDVDASVAVRLRVWSVFGVEARVTGVLSPVAVGLALDGQRLGRLVFPAIHASFGVVANW